MKEQQIVLQNQLVNYYHTSGPNIPLKTVLFLHGWRSEGRVWAPIMESLNSSEFKTYALDLPGFGKSEIPKHDFIVDDYVEQVHTFIEKLSLTTVILVGHSFGGRVAIKFAVRYPELVSRLVLVDSGGIREEPFFQQGKLLLAKIFKPFFRLKLLAKLRLKIYQFMGAEDYLATPKLRQTFLNVIHEDLRPMLPLIKVPTLIIWGDSDDVLPIDHGKEMHSKISHSRFVVLENAGHYSFLDSGKDFLKVLKDFLK